MISSKGTIISTSILTTQRGIAGGQLREMHSSDVSLVVPKAIQADYPRERDIEMLTIDGFISGQYSGAECFNQLTPSFSMGQISFVPQFIGINDRDQAWHDLYKLQISTGERTLIRRNTEQVAGWIFDLQGKLRLAMRVDESGEQQVLRVDAGGLTRIFACSLFDDCHPLQFHRDGGRLYFETNKDLDRSALMLLEAATGEMELLESDPLGRVPPCGHQGRLGQSQGLLLIGG